MDEQAKHTPGPWAVHEHRHADGEFWCSIGQASGRGPIADIIGAEGSKTEFWKPVAGLSYLVTPVEEQRANARLIAAAPEMYEALREALASLEILYQNARLIPDPRMDGTTDVYAVPTDDFECSHEGWNAVRVALAKAEGR